MTSFKALTIENWREADPTSLQFGRVSPLAGVVDMKEQDWARAILAIEPAEHVPEALRGAFRGRARSAPLQRLLLPPLSIGRGPALSSE